nr:hypothetical protein [Alistipes onderdonkii]
MNVTHVTVITTAEETTDNGLYVLEYSVTDGDLIRVQANIMESGNAKSGIPQSVGTISLEQEVIYCNLPKGRVLAPYFSDFDNFLKAIRESLSKQEN